MEKKVQTNKLIYLNIDLKNFTNDDKKEYDENFKTYSFYDYWNGKKDYNTYKLNVQTLEMN